jgi:hypothetical protein
MQKKIAELGIRWCCLSNKKRAEPVHTKSNVAIIYTQSHPGCLTDSGTSVPNALSLQPAE